MIGKLRLRSYFTFEVAFWSVNKRRADRGGNNGLDIAYDSVCANLGGSEEDHVNF